MPSIIDADKQREALKTISAELKNVEGMNRFLRASNESCEYTISFKPAKGKMFSAKVISEDKVSIDALVRATKESIVQEMTLLAQQQRISFDEKDKKIFGIDQPAGSLPYVEELDDPSGTEASDSEASSDSEEEAVEEEEEDPTEGEEADPEEVENGDSGDVNDLMSVLDQAENSRRNFGRFGRSPFGT